MRNKCLWLTPRSLWDFLTASGTDKDIHQKLDLSLPAAPSVAEMLSVRGSGHSPRCALGRHSVEASRWNFVVG